VIIQRGRAVNHLRPSVVKKTKLKSEMGGVALISESAGQLSAGA
jgi:hypothetical protein